MSYNLQNVIHSPAWSRISEDICSLLGPMLGADPKAVTVHFFQHDQDARLPLYPQHRREYQQARQGRGIPAKAPYHTTDYQLVTWNGQRWNFSPMQRKVIEALWKAWESGAPEVSQRVLLDLAGSESDCLHDLFQRHPSWGVLIVRAGPTLYKLAFPVVEDGETDTETGEDHY